VLEGKIVRNSRARLIREEVVIFEGRIHSLKRFKEDAREVASGYECGIGLENWQDVAVGDLIEAYEIEEIARTQL
jgi:translation initiation factor IF-2